MKRNTAQSTQHEADVAHDNVEANNKRVDVQRKTTVIKSTGETSGKRTNTKAQVTQTKKASKKPVKKQSKSALIKQGLCPHCEIKLPTFDAKTHRATCPKCQHIVYFLSSSALTCITCRNERNKKS